LNDDLSYDNRENLIVNNHHNVNIKLNPTSTLRTTAIETPVYLHAAMPLVSSHTLSTATVYSLPKSLPTSIATTIISLTSIPTPSLSLSSSSPSSSSSSLLPSNTHLSNLKTTSTSTTTIAPFTINTDACTDAYYAVANSSSKQYVYHLFKLFSSLNDSLLSGSLIPAMKMFVIIWMISWITMIFCFIGYILFHKCLTTITTYLSKMPKLKLMLLASQLVYESFWKIIKEIVPFEIMDFFINEYADSNQDNNIPNVVSTL